MNGSERDTGERLGRLARDLPPEDLAGRIASALSQLPPPRTSWGRRALAWLARPSVVWSYRLTTLGVLAGILAGVWVLVVRRPLVPSPAVGPKPPAAAVLPTAGRPPAHLVSVTFVYYAPKAASVAVVGTFNDWDPRRTPMVRGQDGSWTVQVSLAPGRYEYLFFVDGSRYETDPDAVEQRPDGLGHENAVLRL